MIISLHYYAVLLDYIFADDAITMPIIIIIALLFSIFIIALSLFSSFTIRDAFTIVISLSLMPFLYFIDDAADILPRSYIFDYFDITIILILLIIDAVLILFFWLLMPLPSFSMFQQALFNISSSIISYQ